MSIIDTDDSFAGVTAAVSVPAFGSLLVSCRTGELTSPALYPFPAALISSPPRRCHPPIPITIHLERSDGPLHHRSRLRDRQGRDRYRRSRSGQARFDDEEFNPRRRKSPKPSNRGLVVVVWQADIHLDPLVCWTIDER